MARFALLVTIAAALAGAAPAGARAVEPPGPLSAPVYTESVDEEFRLPTKWGSIYGWVRRPVVPAGVKVPILLTISPYSIEESPLPGIDLSNTPDPTAYYVPRGYARAWVHLVGTGNSGGCYDYGGVRERETGRDVVEHLGTRSWSNGRVGMIGVSYDGTTQWATAVEAPPHLVTIVPQAAITRWYDYAFQQGVRLASGSGTPLAFDIGFSQVPVPQTLFDPAAAQAIADKVNPCSALDHNQRAFLPDPVYDDFWRERDYVIRAANVRASVLFESSWVDYNVHPINTLQMWRALPASVSRRMLMGQQGHGPAAFDGAQDYRHAWLDHYLLGRDNGVESLRSVESALDGGDVLVSDVWPPRGTAVRRVPLETTAGPDRLRLASGGDPSWSDTVPALSEDNVLQGLGTGASLLFLGDPLDRELRIAGIPLLDLSLHTSAESTFVTPVLFDEAADGSRTVFTRASLNSRNRDAETESKALPPDGRWHAKVRFQPVDVVVAKGHRIGLALMSMNTTEVLYPDTTLATNQLTLGGASILELPIAARIEPKAPPPAAVKRLIAVGRIVSVRRARGQTVVIVVRCVGKKRCVVRARVAGSRTTVRRTVAAGGTARLRLRARHRARVTIVVKAGSRVTRLSRRAP